MIKKSLKGFTIIELIITLTLMMILIGLTFINITPLPARSSQVSAKDLLISDIKSQQVKAMAGDGAGGMASQPHGVHFEEGRYTLFKGESFLQEDPANFVVELPEGTGFTNITFPEGNLIFSKGSGEVAGYVLGNDNVTLAGSQGIDPLPIRINKYGVLYE